MKRVAILALLLLNAVWLRAFDLQYGELFCVTNLTQKKGKVILPVTRGKYTNVRVVDKATYRLLKTCGNLCKQESLGGEISVTQMRKAQTRYNMWIADVTVDSRWLLTFLVFRNKDGFDFIVPQDVRVTDKKWFQQIKQSIQTRIMQDELK
jgi:hypothetical protein